MRAQIRAIAPGVLKSTLIAAATYLIGSGNGLLARLISVELGLWVIPGYVAALTLLASHVTGAFVRTDWSPLLRLVLRSLSLSLLVFGGMSVLPRVGAGLLNPLPLPPGPEETAAAFLRHAAQLAPWTLAYFAVAATLQAAALPFVLNQLPQLGDRSILTSKSPASRLRWLASFAALTFLLTHDGGLSPRGNTQTLGFLEPSTYLALILFFVAFWHRLWPRRESARIAGTLLRGAAWSILAHQLFGNLPEASILFTNTFLLSAEADILSPYAAHASSLRYWTLLFIAVLVAYRIGEPSVLRRLGNGPSPSLTSVPENTSVIKPPPWFTPVRGLSWTCALGAAVYLLLHQRGFLNTAWGVDLSALQGSFYLMLTLHLSGNLVAFTGRSPWHQVSRTALQGLAWGALAFAGLRGIPLVLASLARSQASASLGGSLGPYFGLLPPLAPWVLGYILFVTAYRATTVYWNDPHFPWIPERLRARPDEPIRWFTLAALVAVAIHLLLAPSGLWRFWTGLDFSFLVMPLLAADCVALAGSLVRVLGKGRFAPAAATFLRWSALAVVVFFLTHDLGRVGAEIATTPPFVDVGEQLLPYLAAVRTLDLWLGGGILLFAIHGAGSVYWDQPRFASIRPMINAGLFSVLAGLVWGGFGRLSAMGPIYPGVGAIASGALLAVGIGHLMHYISSHPDTLVRTLAGWSAASPFRNANVGGFIVLYGVFIRPAVYDAFLYAPLLEWSGLIAICLYVIHRTWTNLAAQPASPPESPMWPTWIRHRQEVSSIPDLPLQSATQLQNQFLSGEDGAALVARLAIALDISGVPAQGLAKVIEPLVAHRDRQVSTVREAVVRFIPGGRARYAKRLSHDRDAILRRVAGLLEEARGPARFARTTDIRDIELLWEWAEGCFSSRGSRTELVTAIAVLSARGGAPAGEIAPLVSRVLEYEDPVRSWGFLSRIRRRPHDERETQRSRFVRSVREMTASHARSQVSRNDRLNGAAS